MEARVEAEAMGGKRRRRRRSRREEGSRSRSEAIARAVLDRGRGVAPEVDRGADPGVGPVLEAGLGVEADLGSLVPDQDRGLEADRGRVVAEVDLGRDPEVDPGLEVVNHGREVDRNLEVDPGLGRDPDREANLEADRDPDLRNPEVARDRHRDHRNPGARKDRHRDRPNPGVVVDLLLALLEEDRIPLLPREAGKGRTPAVPRRQVPCKLRTKKETSFFIYGVLAYSLVHFPGYVIFW